MASSVQRQKAAAVVVLMLLDSEEKSRRQHKNRRVWVRRWIARRIVILLYAYKLAFLASSTCVKIIEFSFRNEARKDYLHLYKIIIIMPAIYERGLCFCY